MASAADTTMPINPGSAAGRAMRFGVRRCLVANREVAPGVGASKMSIKDAAAKRADGLRDVGVPLDVMVAGNEDDPPPLPVAKEWYQSSIGEIAELQIF
jgi:hypothetical protein